MAPDADARWLAARVRDSLAVQRRFDRCINVGVVVDGFQAAKNQMTIAITLRNGKLLSNTLT
ncbi:MAG: hypothetical protein H6645_11950 [Caldilineaceae bacterium]|nr:hypothetical protein [Caldilineaceae bacterium]